MRKDRSSNRRLRTRVLAALLAAVGALAALASCTGGKPGAPARASWFQLQTGVFQLVAGPGSAPPVAELPWTIQSRVADMAFLGDTLEVVLAAYAHFMLDNDRARAIMDVFFGNPTKADPPLDPLFKPKQFDMGEVAHDTLSLIHI